MWLLLLNCKEIDALRWNIISHTNIVHEKVLISMDISILNAYLAGEISGHVFIKGIKNEVLNFIESTSSENRSIKIIGSEPDFAEFGEGRMLSLLKKYLDGDLGEWELEYILRVLEFEFEEEVDIPEHIDPSNPELV